MFRHVCILLCALLSSVTALNEIKIEARALKDIAPRIVNGDEASLGQFPWQIGIYGRNSVGYYFCGGSFISEEWVLTAAHCLDGAIGANIYSNATKISDSTKVVSQAIQFIQHEGYIADLLRNDIGLIRLKEPVQFNEYTKPVALAIKDPPVGTNVTVSGWGVTKDSDLYTSDILYYTNVETITNEACTRIYGSNYIVDQVICANPGDPHTSPCQGDSGAPVVVLNSCGIPVQIAVFSFTNGYGCEYPYPSGNTRVSYFRDWIREKTGI
ncbi:hypothetical protein Zmor_018865 [Zophobas morio]|uniref:Peptidase S1 domain-containing protein n=1 Tax=Zophobas morio TaxID=2755281 RepID=A0AA38MDU9_9CUCU|nr:hypothetical protein Zmor_018865 [Zophobas morio]